MRAVAWETSNRRGRLPVGWDRIRRFVLERDNYRCQVLEGRNFCLRHAKEVHHLQTADDGLDNDHPDNLIAICRRHHAMLTHIHSTKRRLEKKKEPTVDLSNHPGIL